MHITWVPPSTLYAGILNTERTNLPDHPDYDQLNWYPVHNSGVRFGALDSYDIYGLYAMILRWIPFSRIRYILGTTGDGSQSLCSNPDIPLSQFETI